jgi:Raf kinase inhibitor-like YbhB/YbcL family protein
LSRPVSAALACAGTLAIAAAVGGCGSSKSSKSSSASSSSASSSSTQRPSPQSAIASGTASIRLQSPSFADRTTLPRRFTCDGRGVSPALSWSAVPKGTRSIVLLLEDPDAPNGTFTHWSVYAIPKKVRKVAAGKIPSHAKLGRNSLGKVGYGPPCPPKGAHAHRYVFTVYAVPHKAAFGGGADITAVSRLAASASAKGVLTAHYGR